MIHVCRDCPDRTVGCHASCERYLRARAKQDLVNLCRMKEEQKYPAHASFHKGMNKNGDPTKTINRYKRKT